MGGATLMGVFIQGLVSSDAKYYTNVLTGQCFYTKENLDRYVAYVKRDLPQIYANWGNGKKAVGATNSVPRNPVTLLNGRMLSLEGTSKHLIKGTSKCPREGASKHHTEGTFKRPRDREKPVCTTGSDLTTVPNAIIDTVPATASRVPLPKAGIYAVYMRKKWKFSKIKPHDPFINRFLADRNHGVSVTGGMTNGVDATCSIQVVATGASPERANGVDATSSIQVVVTGASPERANAGDGDVESMSFDEVPKQESH